MSTRNEMQKALQTIVVPRLRERGFKGSFPNFRRHHPDRIDLLTFQFNRYGGSFILELGQCGAQGVLTSWNEHIAPDKVTPCYLGIKQRTRIPYACLGTDEWFDYDNAINTEDFERTAQSVLPFLEIVDKIFDESLFPDERALKAFEKTGATR